MPKIGLIAMYEIGVTYMDKKKIYLAIARSTLATLYKGRFKEYENISVKLKRYFSVDELCNEWGVTIAALDVFTAKYLSPPQSGVKASSRQTRKSKQLEVSLWKNQRTTRIA